MAFSSSIKSKRFKPLLLTPLTQDVALKTQHSFEKLPLLLRPPHLAVFYVGAHYGFGRFFNSSITGHF